MATHSTEEREQSIAALFRELSQESAALVRDELRLVRDDVADQARRVGASAGLIGGAAALGAGAFGAATAGLVSALGRGRPGRGALLVSLLYGGGAAGLALAAREQLRTVVPDAADTADIVRRDVKAATTGATEGA